MWQIRPSDIFLTLIPESEAGPFAQDPETYREECQRFEQSIQTQGLEIEGGSQPRSVCGYVEPWLYLGDFCIRLAPTIGPILGTAAGAWLHARYGRKVRLKIGEIEAEAQTPAEIEKLLEKAQEIQRANQPKIIHEP